MSAELTQHLGYEKHDPAGYNSGNSRNGASAKTVKGEFGEVVVDTPRDRNGSFEPQILPMHQTRFDGFDDEILSMYARGMTTREIQGHLQEMYSLEVEDLLSVRIRGLEPPRRCRHMNLNHARLPVPPHPHHQKCYPKRYPAHFHSRPSPCFQRSYCLGTIAPGYG